MADFFPRQDISETEKNKNDKLFFKQCIDYAILRSSSNNKKRLARLRRMYNGYNGIIDDKNYAQFNRTYGNRDNLVKYIDYRLCRTKIDHIIGEQLEQPINGTVYTTNPDAHVRLLEDVHPMIGLHYAEDKVKALREKVGVDIFDGMQPPQVPEGKTIFEVLSAKSKNERNMQLIMNRQIDDMEMKLKFSDNMSDTTLLSECFGKAYIDDNGNVKYRAVSPELAIFEESDKDPFLEYSPYRGEMRTMFIHDILKEFRPDKATADLLNERNDGGTAGIDSDYIGYYDNIDGQFAFRVYTIQWEGCEAIYIKKYKDKEGNDGEAEISSDFYEANKRRIDYDVAQGKYTLDVKYHFPWYEATRIGHDIYLNMGKVKNMPFSNSNPSKSQSNYVGLLFNTKAGVRVSIKQLSEHIDHMYNMVMWQIMRELAKSKGKVIGYDLAMLPKGKNSIDVMHNITNDQIYFYNSAEDGNVGGVNRESLPGIREADLGVSNSVNILIPLKLNLEQMADRITGIAQGRMGNAPASATVEGTQMNVQNSLTTTAPLFYYFNKFQERVLKLILELSKISYGILKPEKGEMVLGLEGFNYLQLTQDLAFDDYGFSLGNAKKEMDIRQMLRTYMGVAINANPELIEAALDSEIAETLAEAQGAVKKIFRDLREIRQQEAQAAAKAKMEQDAVNAQAQVDLQTQISDREAQNIALKGNVKLAENNQKAANQAVLEQNSPGKR